MVNQPQEEAIDVTPELDGGVLKTVLKEGEGVSKPSNGCKVSVHYVGTLTDGTVFDSSRERSEPFEFELGKDHVIKAWDIGIATMRKGEIAKLTCQPQYAYGAAGSPPKIPPNATLIFEVEMISWKAEDLSPKRDGGILRTIIESGEGFSSPNDGATVDIHLTGECNGQVFEDRDVIFCIGEGSEHNICDGVERALEKFKIKEKSKLQIKSRYAFGSAGKPELNIPPNADLEYTITLNNFEKLKDFWTLDAPEKLAQASFFKEKGSRYFKEGKYELACKLYDKMNSYINSTAGFSEAEEVSVKDLQKAMHLNLALCYLKLNRNLDARNECNSVLEVDPDNEKALFRRGQSYMNLAEPEPAIKDFETVLKLDPKNSAATRGIQQCKDLLKKQRSQEKKIYANMFEKFAKHDKEKEEEERKQQPDVMKTLGEWGEDEREREPTKFEKENPNIFMLDGNGDFKNM